MKSDDQSRKREWDLLELQRRNMTGKACDNCRHLPWPKIGPTCPRSAALRNAIVLFQAPRWIRRRPDIQRVVSDRGTKQIAAPEGGDGALYWRHEDVLVLRCGNSAPAGDGMGSLRQCRVDGATRDRCDMAVL